jgi:hypothetical protein
MTFVAIHVWILQRTIATRHLCSKPENGRNRGSLGSWLASGRALYLLLPGRQQWLLIFPRTEISGDAVVNRARRSGRVSPDPQDLGCKRDSRCIIVRYCG